MDWSLSDTKFSQVSRTLLSIPADLNNNVVFDGLGSSSDFQIFELSHIAIRDRSKCATYN